MCTLDERPSVFIRDNPFIWSERLLHNDYDGKGSMAKGLRRLVAKTNRWAVNLQ
jgi:hypothetical protein